MMVGVALILVNALPPRNPLKLDLVALACSKGHYVR